MPHIGRSICSPAQKRAKVAQESRINVCKGENGFSAYKATRPSRAVLDVELATHVSFLSFRLGCSLNLSHPKASCFSASMFFRSLDLICLFLHCLVGDGTPDLFSPRLKRKRMPVRTRCHTFHRTKLEHLRFNRNLIFGEARKPIGARKSPRMPRIGLRLVGSTLGSFGVF